MKGALPYPFYALQNACLNGIVLVRPGVQTDNPYNPLMATKLWCDTRPNLPPIVHYRVVQIIPAGAGSGKPVLESLSLGRAWAQSLNVPSGAASEGPPGEPELPFPLRDLFEDEKLMMNPGQPAGVVMIQNVELYAALVIATPSQDTPADAEILSIVKELLARLDRAGLN